MRYKELNEEDFKKYLDYYFNLELLDKKPAVGDIAYEHIVNNRSIVIYSTNNYCGDGFKPIGIVFAVSRRLMIVHLSETKLNWTSGQDYCKNIKDGGGGWYMPDKEELNEIYKNKDLINDTIDKLSFGSKLSNDWHWSSSSSKLSNDWHRSSSSDLNDYAWSQSFYDGDQFTGHRSNPGSVRAVRALTI